MYVCFMEEGRRRTYYTYPFLRLWVAQRGRGRSKMSFEAILKAHLAIFRLIE